MLILRSKKLHFEGAHRLDFLPAEHKCSRLHGHSWTCQFDVGGEPDVNGMMTDYDDLTKAFMSQVHAVIDHRYLNEIPGLEKPTTEAIAEWIAFRLQDGLKVPVRRVHIVEGFAGGEAIWLP